MNHFQHGEIFAGERPQMQDRPGALRLVTLLLDDALPQDKLASIVDSLPVGEQRERQRRLHHLLDSGYGSCLLAKPKAAELLDKALQSFNGRQFELLSWVIMPSHVHLLTGTNSGYNMAQVLLALMDWTEEQFAERLKTSGRVWSRQYREQLIRDEEHMYAAIEFIHSDPVRAGLCLQPEDWEYSSAVGLDVRRVVSVVDALLEEAC
jgi:REP element-mobilizing transposase RayT